MIGLIRRWRYAPRHARCTGRHELLFCVACASAFVECLVQPRQEEAR